MKTPSRAAVLLSLVSAGCATLASVVTLLWDGSFPAPSGTSGFNAALAEARGWSLVSLLVAVPLLLISLLAARQGSRRGQLAWLGTLAYLVYTYLELAVSPPFTALYLPYILAFGCAIPALLLGASSIDTGALARALGSRVPRRSVAAFGLALGVLLSLAWLKGILTQTVAGEFGWPLGIAAIGHVVHALDLGLQVPLGIGTALLVLQRKPAGALLAPILLVNSVCMGLALTAMVVSSALSSGDSPLLGAPFAGIALVASVLAARFFQALQLAANDRSTARDVLAEQPASPGSTR